MFTDTQLEQLGKVIDERLDAKIGPIIDVKLEPITKRLESLEQGQKEQGSAIARLEQGQQELGKGQQELIRKVAMLEQGQARIEKKLSREITGNAEALHEISMKLNQLEDHGERIKQLEEDNKFLPH